MDFHDIERLEGAILYGIVNEKLRLECGDLHDFLLQFDIEKQHFLFSLDKYNYYYDPVVNQLRQK